MSVEEYRKTKMYEKRGWRFSRKKFTREVKTCIYIINLTCNTFFNSFIPSKIDLVPLIYQL